MPGSCTAPWLAGPLRDALELGRRLRLAVGAPGSAGRPPSRPSGRLGPRSPRPDDERSAAVDAPRRPCAPNPSIDRLYELDRLVRGAVNRPLTETLVAGGKGLNVARAAIALGAEVGAVGLLAGHAGRWMAETLAAGGDPRALGVDRWRDSNLRRDPRRGGRQPDRAERGRTDGERDRVGRPRDALRAELAVGHVGLVTISGSLPPGAPPDGLAELTARATEAGIRVAVDAAGEPLRRALEVRPWLVKLNVAEAAATLGRPLASDQASDDDVARHSARDRRAGPAARSSSPVACAGAVALDPDGAATPRPSRRRFAAGYPVGSGDAFLAGRAVATLEGGSFADALRLGAAAAERQCARPRRRSARSADAAIRWRPGHPDRADRPARSVGRAVPVGDRRSQAAGRPSARTRSPMAEQERSIASRSIGLDALEEVRLDPAKVGPTRLTQASMARLGQHGLRAAAVGRAVAARDEPVGLQPVDEASDAAPAEDDAVGELVHPQPAVRRLGQLEERRVLGQRHLLLGPEVIVQASADEGVGSQERSPRRQARIARTQAARSVGSDSLLGGLAHRRIILDPPTD